MPNLSQFMNYFYFLLTADIIEEYNSEVAGYATGITFLTTKKLSVAKSAGVAE